MWMGDYPVLPAKDLKTGEELHKIVDENKEQLLGSSGMKKFGGVVPFLPKVCDTLARHRFGLEIADKGPDTLDSESIASTDSPGQGTFGPAAQERSQKVHGFEPQARNCDSAWTV